MPLSLIIDNLEGLSEDVQKLYVENEGKFHLSLVEPVVPKTKLDEFRTNNIQHKKDLDKLNKQLKAYGDVDPAKVKELQAKIQEIADKDMIDEGKLDELLEQRTERMKADFDSQNTTLITKNDELTADLKKVKAREANLVIDTSITAAVQDVGILRKGAMTDILSRGRVTWMLDDDGLAVPMGLDGSTLFGKDGKSVLTMQEWAAGLLTEAPFLFEASTGGGARGGNTGTGNLDLTGLSPMQKLKTIRKVKG